MTRSSLCPIIATTLAAVIGGPALAQNNPPVVSNVTASQRPDASKLVDIYYNLADADGDACTVWVMASNNGGVTWGVAMLSVNGDVGAGITPGAGKHIIWDAGTNPGMTGTFVVRVYADDGHAPMDMVMVYAGSFQYQASQWVYVQTFYIDRYEVTNIQYCAFLNEADPNSEHWSADMEIVRSGTAGSYTYGVVPSKENYPIRYTSLYDAEAFAAWRSTRDGVTYRLPTQYEWEKAAAWDPVEGHYYLYGFHRDTISCAWCNYNNCIGGPRPIGTYNGTGGLEDAKSYYSCYDMSGNVREWTSEECGQYEDAYRTRGGAWDSTAWYCECTNLSYCYPPNWRDYRLGFRLVLDPN